MRAGLLVQEAAALVCEFTHRRVKHRPHSTLPAERRDHTTVKKAEHMLRPIQRREISAQTRLPEVAAAGRKRERVSFHQTAVGRFGHGHFAD